MQEDEFDSTAMPLSVRDPGFIAPHLLLSMSLPTNGADFGRGVFRPVNAAPLRVPSTLVVQCWPVAECVRPLYRSGYLNKSVLTLTGSCNTWPYRVISARQSLVSE